MIIWVEKKMQTTNNLNKQTMLMHNFKSSNRSHISQGEYNINFWNQNNTYNFTVFLGELDEMILDLIVNASLPFNLVNHENFKKMINHWFPGENVLYISID